MDYFLSESGYATQPALDEHVKTVHKNLKGQWVALIEKGKTGNPEQFHYPYSHIANLK